MSLSSLLYFTPLGMDLNYWESHRLPEDSTCHFYSLIFLEVYLGEKVREKREEKQEKPPKSGEGCLQALCEASCDSFSAISSPGLKDALR